MADLTNIRLSLEASEIAKELSERYYFKDTLPFLQFAMAYGLNHLDGFDYNTLDKKYDSLGFNYNVGSIRKSAEITTAFNTIFPNCETPFRYIRVLMIYGTYKIKECIANGVDFRDIMSIDK